MMTAAAEAEPRAPRDDGHLPDEAAALGEHAVRVLAKAQRRGLTLATAESCTGGLLASLLTDQDGLGHCFDRGFVTYTNEAKHQMLGVPTATLERHGAVSRETAEAMVRGALGHANADLAVSITGIAGPGGGTPEKPVGLVHFAIAASRSGKLIHHEHRYGDVGRAQVRQASVLRVLGMLHELAVGEDFPN
jgi:nicotinamide-nucleotide amidase